MNKNTITAALGMFFLSYGTCFSQSVHVIELRDFEFTPSNITVLVGDTVRWSAVQGHHNVRADDNSFTSGPPATAPWIFNHVFVVAGNNPYYCEPHGAPGGLGMSGVVIVNNPVSVFDDGLFADKFELNQNYPNPFNPTTIIRYTIPSVIASVTKQSKFISLKVYDILGNEVTTLVNEYKPAGSYEVEFNASELTSGIYFYRLTTGNFNSTKKMVVVK